MLISIINHTSGKLKDKEVQDVIRVVNRQITEDFTPYWGMEARLRLEGESGDQPDKLTLPEMRGDAVLYLWDKADVAGAVGYHDRNLRGIPYGFVFVSVAESLGEKWTATFSHEALELIADPHANLLAMGPHPEEPDVTVFHWFEMSDAVQAETYDIEGVTVSNFVLPLYFTPDDEAEGRNDFLGTINPDGKSLKSFGVNPGGYVGFFDPRTKEHRTFAARKDKVAEKRLRIKEELNKARRAVRYQRFHTAGTQGEEAHTRPDAAPAHKPRGRARKP